jgi:hypothetical protein
LKEKEVIGNRGVNGKIILKYISKKEAGRE